MLEGEEYARGVPKTDDCCCATVLVGVGDGGARARTGEGARGVLSPNTDDCCCANVLLGLVEVDFPAAKGGGGYSRGVPKADDRCCACVLEGMGRGRGFCGFGGTG